MNVAWLKCNLHKIYVRLTKTFMTYNLFLFIAYKYKNINIRSSRVVDKQKREGILLSKSNFFNELVYKKIQP